MSTADPGGRDRMISYATYYLQRDVQPAGVLEMLRQRFPEASALALAVAFGDALRQARLAEDLNDLRPDQPLSDVLPPGMAALGTIELAVLVDVEMPDGTIESGMVTVNVPTDATLEDITAEAQAGGEGDDTVTLGTVTHVEIIPPALSGRS